MGSLAEKNCVPCRGGVPPLTGKEIEPLLKQIPGWELNSAGHLEKIYTFNGFVPALAFVNKIGVLAEEQDHHPDIQLSWGKVVIELWTHKINGLTENDFIFAARCQRIKS